MTEYTSPQLAPNDSGVISVIGRATVRHTPDDGNLAEGSVTLQLWAQPLGSTEWTEVKGTIVRVEAMVPTAVTLQLTRVLPNHSNNGPPGVAGVPWNDPETIRYRFVVTPVIPGALDVPDITIEQLDPPARAFIRYKREVQVIPSVEPGVKTQVVDQPYWYYPPEPRQ
jgi:hypothetical protein